MSFSHFVFSGIRIMYHSWEVINFFSNVIYEIHKVKIKQFIEFSSKTDFQITWLNFFYLIYKFTCVLCKKFFIYSKWNNIMINTDIYVVNGGVNVSMIQYNVWSLIISWGKMSFCSIKEKGK